MDQKPSVGRIVHFVMPPDYAKAAGQVRPGIVVRTWDETAGTVNLQVFTDGMNDGFADGYCWRTSVAYNEGGAPGTWHWPPRV